MAFFQGKKCWWEGALLVPDAPGLSANTVSRLKSVWNDELMEETQQVKI